MSKFKVGDLVRALPGRGISTRLPSGREFVVLGTDRGYVQLVDCSGEYSSWVPSRFELASPTLVTINSDDSMRDSIKRIETEEVGESWRNIEDVVGVQVGEMKQSIQGYQMVFNQAYLDALGLEMRVQVRTKR